MKFFSRRRIIQKCRCVDIKQKAGCVAHIDDPTNLRSTFAHTLSTERYVCWRTHVRFNREFEINFSFVFIIFFSFFSR